jgi:electron transport complex protein RnfE
MLSLFDGLGMGLGFTIGLTAIGIFREWLGNGTIFNVKMMPSAYEPITIFVLAPGAFFVLAFLVAVINRVNRSKAAKTGAAVRCDAGCAGCASAGICGGHGVVESAVQADTKQEQEGGK